MTNRLDAALEQVGHVFLEMAQEIRELKNSLQDLEVLVHKHESTNCKLGEVFKDYR